MLQRRLVGLGSHLKIIQAGHPMFKANTLAAQGNGTRLGFMAGKLTVPDDFDRMGEGDLERLFSGDAAIGNHGEGICKV